MLDAYSIRKALPRLVFAVIALQFSWSFCYWFITLINDLGKEIGDILYSIFNNGNPIDIQQLIKGGFGPDGAGLFASLAILGFAGAAIIGIFASMALAIPVLISVLIAVVILTMRQVIILLCVILVPFAIVAWILPNTQKYWKLWWSTFSKMLFMFPMIIALIVMGRVFAQLAEGGSGNPNSLSVFILVLVGYFGPYFMLPQTFKWGGQLLGSASQAGNRLGKRIGERPSNFFKSRQQSLSEQRQRNSARRVDNNEGFGLNRQWRRGFGVASIWRTPIDKARSGQWDPTMGFPGSERRQRKYEAYSALGGKVEAQAQQDAEGRLTRAVQDMDLTTSQRHLEQVAMNPRSEAEFLAAMRLLYQKNSTDQIERIRTSMQSDPSNERQMGLWQRSANQNYEKGRDLSPTVLNPEAYVNPGEYAQKSNQELAAMDASGWSRLNSIDPALFATLVTRVQADPQANSNFRLDRINNTLMRKNADFTAAQAAPVAGEEASVTVMRQAIAAAASGDAATLRQANSHDLAHIATNHADATTQANARAELVARRNRSRGTP